MDRSFTLTSIVVLEFVVAGIILFGGTLLTVLSENKLLGSVHAFLGLLGFPVAYGLWIRKGWAAKSALALNIVSISYSSLSETIVVNSRLLGSGALEGSIGGTVISVIISLAIILLLVAKQRRL
jgi:hypothetical protein